jgi:hypothetical protein
MSTSATPSVHSIVSTSTAYDEDDDFQLGSVGIELEYPTGDEISGRPTRSRDLRDGCREQNMDADLPRDAWLDENGSTDGGANPTGYMGSDHTGAEITSGILPLHTGSPEAWYQASINEAEGEYGHPFGASGRGSTNFGMHNHISSLTEDQVDAIEEMCSNEYARVFFCTSIDHNSLDPWRHGGVRSPESSFRTYSGEGHYEFRLPEPMLPEHFGLLMDFWRTIENDSVEAAIDFARELVHERDERLTAVQQFRELQETDRLDREQAVSDSRYTDRFAAEWFLDLME